MKYIRLFEDFFGNNLWSDITYPDRGYNVGYGKRERKLFTDYIQKMYDSPDFENNTHKEDDLLVAIEMYLSEGDGSIIHLKGLLHKLLKYKKLYPEMLDPGLNNPDMVYRGMTMEFNEVHDIIDSCESLAKIRPNIGRSYVVLKGANTTVTSRQDIGFISTSTRIQTAATFQDNLEDYDARWPIIAAAQFSKIEKKCIMNPDFLNALNPMDESETWILGNQIESKDIYLQVFDPRDYKGHIKRYPNYGKLSHRIWGIYNDVRTKSVR